MTASTPPHQAPERITGAHAIVRTLEDLGTDLVFGIPGGAVLPLYDALFESTKLRHVLTRHEQGAVLAVESPHKRGCGLGGAVAQYRREFLYVALAQGRIQLFFVN